LKEQAVQLCPFAENPVKDTVRFRNGINFMLREYSPWLRGHDGPERRAFKNETTISLTKNDIKQINDELDKIDETT